MAQYHLLATVSAHSTPNVHKGEIHPGQGPPSEVQTKTPLHRGLEAVEEDKHYLARLDFAEVTDSDSDGEVDDTSAVFSDREAESAPSENEEKSSHEDEEDAGPCLLNLRTGSSHRAIPLCGSNNDAHACDAWGLWCRPTLQLGSFLYRLARQRIVALCCPQFKR